jgi:hypothetical protein
VLLVADRGKATQKLFVAANASADIHARSICFCFFPVLQNHSLFADRNGNNADHRPIPEGYKQMWLLTTHNHIYSIIKK